MHVLAFEISANHATIFFCGNLIFVIIARMLCGNHLKAGVNMNLSEI